MEVVTDDLECTETLDSSDHDKSQQIKQGLVYLFNTVLWFSD